MLELYDGVIGIGSGGSYVLAAARALVDVSGMKVFDIVKKVMMIVVDMCVYMNYNFIY